MKFSHSSQLKIENFLNSIKEETMQKQSIIVTDNKHNMKLKS